MTQFEERLARILVENSYLHRQPGEPPFRLASGRESDFYFDCQRTTSKAEALPCIGEAFLSRLKREVRSVGGLTRGADPIAGAIAYTAALQNRQVDSFSVRKSQKDHGTQRWIEGWADPSRPVALVDDVITTGSSVIKAIERCRDEGIRIIQVIVLVDREEGGLENIQKELDSSVPVTAIFTKRELDSISEANGRQPDTKRDRSVAATIREQPHR